MPNVCDLVPVEIIPLVSDYTNTCPVYLVGGAIRDRLLNRTTHDLDFVVDGNPRLLARNVANTLQGAFFMLDEERNTARVIFQKKQKRQILDFASLRGDSLVHDLNARDFTINAIAVDFRKPDTLIDPLNGAQDIVDKRLRACSHKSFADDPVRILRGLRLALDNDLLIDKGTLKSLKQTIPNLLDVSSERIRDELFRMLELPKASSGLRLLDQLNILTLILPEMERIKRLDQSLPHARDVWEHSLAMLVALFRVYSASLGEYGVHQEINQALYTLRLVMRPFKKHLKALFDQSMVPDRPRMSNLAFAVMYHDVGKANTRVQDSDGRVSFIGHEKISAKIASERGRALALSQSEITYIHKIIRNHMRIHLLALDPNQPTRKAIYRYFNDMGEAGIDLCLFSLADTMAIYQETLPEDTWMRVCEIIRCLMEAWWEKREAFVQPQKFLNGDDIQKYFGVNKGPMIGKVLDAVREAQACGDILDKDAAAVFVSNWLKLYREDADEEVDNDRE